MADLTGSTTSVSVLKSCSSFIGTTAANLGLSIAVLRMAVHALKLYYLPKLSQIQKQANSEKEGDANALKRYEYFTLLLRLALGNLLFQSSSSSGGEGDAYFNAVYGKKGNNQLKSFQSSTTQQTLKGNTPKKERKIVHRGSCHCNSVQFALRAKPDFEAIDCPGKIRYPHILVESTEFKITRGSKFLQMYYVNVPNDDFPQDGSYIRDGRGSCESTTAAHAFCMRCGVAILRAPDRTQDCVQVNANCINDGTADEMSVSFYSSDDCNSLGSGRALKGQWNQNFGPVDDDNLSIYSENFEVTMAGTMALGSKPISRKRMNNTPRTESIASGSWLGKTLDLDSVASPLESSSVGSYSGEIASTSWSTTSVLRPYSRTIANSETKRQFDSYLSRHFSSDDSTKKASNSQIDYQAYFEGSMSREPLVPTLAVTDNSKPLNVL